MKLMLVGHVTATTWWMQYVLISFTLSYFVVHLKVNIKYEKINKMLCIKLF